MASIQKEIAIMAGGDAVWDAVQDFGAVHVRLVPGFLTDCRLEGDVRTVTFSNGVVAKEQLVDCNHSVRRLAYSVLPNERVFHYNAVLQVFAGDQASCRLVWTVDFLPHELAAYIEKQMTAALSVMGETLGPGAKQ
jgi:hypothetical protein